MGTIATKDGVEIYYKDWGKGQPIVFSHGWPLSADDWDAQMLFFLNHGYRVVAHDRRGHGRSSQVATGHDMDHYADDLAAVVAHLDLRNAIMLAIPRAVARWRTISRATAKTAFPRLRSSARCRL
jgi:non-heme chloroperoxidase